MKNFLKYLFLSMLLCALAPVAVSCSDDDDAEDEGEPTTSIVGSWYTRTDGSYYIFHGSDTLYMYKRTDKSEKATMGEYSFDAQEMVLTLTHDTVRVFDYSVEKLTTQQLVLVAEDGKTIKMDQKECPKSIDELKKLAIKEEE